jgi:hypothetical protein
MRPGPCSRDAALAVLEGCCPGHAQGMRPGLGPCLLPGPCSRDSARAVLKVCGPGHAQGMRPGPYSWGAARAMLKGCGHNLYCDWLKLMRPRYLNTVRSGCGSSAAALPQLTSESLERLLALPFPGRARSGSKFPVPAAVPNLCMLTKMSVCDRHCVCRGLTVSESLCMLRLMAKLDRRPRLCPGGGSLADLAFKF